MKFLIAGAGAIGGYIGAQLARAGADVTLLARGPHLRAMQERGLHVLSADGDFEVRPRVIASLDQAELPDVIVLGVKAHGLAQLAPLLGPLLRGSTVVMSTQNGIPWWYFQSPDGGKPGERRITLDSVDAGGTVAAAIPLRTVIASIAYFATEIAEPGVIRQLEGNRLSLGEPDGSASQRCKDVAAVLQQAGIRPRVTQHIRTEIWVKILGNVAFNPLSVITRATLGVMASDPVLVPVVRGIMEEVEAIAAKLGIEMPVSIDQRIAGALKVGDHKTSMLQDFEAGRPMEIEEVAGAVVELGVLLDLPMPRTRTVYACARLLGRQKESRA